MALIWRIKKNPKNIISVFVGIKDENGRIHFNAFCLFDYFTVCLINYL